ncbi:MAG: caspase family protein [Candidatus Aminicenantes bacterium]|nr:caspase family protein [Candidatus Aminicenantes bacterium]
MKRSFTSLLGLTCLFLILNTDGGQAKVNKKYSSSLSLQKRPLIKKTYFKVALSFLRGPDLKRYLNKSIEIAGYFYDGSIPMLVSDYDRVLVDYPLSRQDYIPLVGNIPSPLVSGQKIVVKGILSKPLSSDPSWVRKEPSLIRVGNLVYKRRSPEKEPFHSLLKLKILPFKGALRKGTTRFIFRPKYRVNLPEKYAILIAGGIDEANNHIRYWNDLKVMYRILLANGYKPENITVIYADGSRRDNDLPINYSATRANLRQAFRDLAQQVTSLDTVYIMLGDHGGGVLLKRAGSNLPGIYGAVIDRNGDEDDEIDEEAVDLDLNRDGDKKDVLSYDETLFLWGGEFVTDDFFAQLVNLLSRCQRIIIQMKQCFSGGFIEDLRAPRRTIMASTSEYNFSYSYADYGVYTYWYFSAFLGGELPRSFLVADRANAGEWEWFDLEDLGDDKVAFRAHNGLYVRYNPNFDCLLTANGEKIGDWETFVLEDLGKGEIALRADNGKYVCADANYYNFLIADRTERKEWEKFRLIRNRAGKVALQAHNGRFVCAEAARERWKVDADTNNDGRISIVEAYNLAFKYDRSETPFFEDDGQAPSYSSLMPRNGEGRESLNVFLSSGEELGAIKGKIALKAHNGFFVCADLGKKAFLVADRSQAREWETFEVIELSAGQIALKASNGKYVGTLSQQDPRLVAKYRFPRGKAVFRLIRVGGGKIAFKASNGKYVCADSGLGNVLIADRNEIQAWEKFEVIQK